MNWGFQKGVGGIGSGGGGAGEEIFEAGKAEGEGGDGARNGLVGIER